MYILGPFNLTNNSIHTDFDDFQKIPFSFKKYIFFIVVKSFTSQSAIAMLWVTRNRNKMWNFFWYFKPGANKSPKPIFDVAVGPKMEEMH